MAGQKDRQCRPAQSDQLAELGAARLFAAGPGPNFGQSGKRVLRPRVGPYGRDPASGRPTVRCRGPLQTDDRSASCRDPSRKGRPPARRRGPGSGDRHHACLRPQTEQGRHPAAGSAGAGGIQISQVRSSRDREPPRPDGGTGAGGSNPTTPVAFGRFRCPERRDRAPVQSVARRQDRRLRPRRRPPGLPGDTHPDRRPGRAPTACRLAVDGFARRPQSAGDAHERPRSDSRFGPYPDDQGRTRPSPALPRGRRPLQGPVRIDDGTRPRPRNERESAPFNTRRSWYSSHNRGGVTGKD
jgi:hypothetical protein